MLDYIIHDFQRPLQEVLNLGTHLVSDRALQEDLAGPDESSSYPSVCWNVHLRTSTLGFRLYSDPEMAD